MRLRKAVIKFILLLTSFAIAFALCEFLVRRTPLSERSGWLYQYSTLDERIRESHTQSDAYSIVIGAFGDSMTEYMRNTQSNFLSVAERALNRQGKVHAKIVNFGYGGTGLRDYIANFKYVADHLKLDVALFNIYVGNDFADYWISKIAYDAGVQDAPVPPWPEPFTRPDAWSKRVLKSSLFLGMVWRYGVKRFLGWDYGYSLNGNLASLGRIFGVSQAEIDRRLAEIPKPLLTQAKADIINSGILAWAVIQPDAFLLENRGYGMLQKDVEGAFKQDVDYLLQQCVAKHVACAFTFIPTDVSVHEKYHGFYRSLGYRLDSTILRPSILEEKTIEHLKERKVPFLSFYPVLAKSDEWVYLKNDMHLNPEGNRIIGNALGAWLGSLLGSMDGKLGG